MGFDLSDAYQQVPNWPAQRQRFVFSVGDQFFVWLVGMFGIATMSAIFGQLCDVLCVWLEQQFPKVKARHFADDHMVMKDSEGPSESDVYAQVDVFGWKVHPTKRFGWTRHFSLLGFEWNLDDGTVALGEGKRDKYLRKLTAFQQREKVTYREVSSMLGTLVHTCAVFGERRAHLNALYALRARFHRPSPHQSLELPTAARRETKEWMAFLQRPDLSRSYGIPAKTFAHTLRSDASDMGCGVVLDGRATYWPLPGWIERPEVDIGVMEAWALHLALQASITAGARDCVVKFDVDNLGVVFAMRKGRSRSRWTNRCLMSMAELAAQHGISMAVSYIASADNPADAPSRGDCSQFAPLTFDWVAPWQELQGVTSQE
ncbi:hypothetical protein A4X13_0g8232 [Tilletia indica]|uniref:Reverse transcriptase domain-containing protein n=1 Tax=Tilletia indica TaxID=43049 RepID=A0A177T3G0_9BASI|nr:hypothetical protein A4X13_0g8232 [Tilletia indica]